MDAEQTRDSNLTSSAHWGAFSPRVADGRLVGVDAWPGDPAPSRLLDSMASSVHAATRIDRPYVRAGWLRGDRKGGTPRGGEAFVPVDWDTAVRLVAGEVARVRDNHGPASIFGGSYGWASAGRFHHARSQLKRLLALSGGYTDQLTNYSYAAGMTLLPHIIGSNSILESTVVAWPDICAHARVMLCFGGLLTRNGQITPGGGTQHSMGHWAGQAARAGVRLIHVSPLRSDSVEGVNSEWLPIRPGTDTALMMGMAHTLITEGRVDAVFLDRCTTGYATLRDDIISLGRTPAWAETQTGIPAATIAQLARDCADNPSMLTCAWSLQRIEHGEQPYWMLIALASMLGQIGRPGCGVSFGHGSMNGMGAPRAELPSVNLPATVNPANSYIPVARITDMLEHPGADYDYNGRRMTYPHARMIWWAGGNPFHHHQDLNRLLRAWASVETIVASEPWWNTLARHADIVLPATTTLERDDIGSSSRDSSIIAMKQAIAPVGQARSEFDYMSDIADLLGIRDRYTMQRDVRTWLRVLYERNRDVSAKLDVALPDFDTFWARGAVRIPLPVENAVPFAHFVRDPQKTKLNTPSGRIEISSPTIAGYGYANCPGHPVWLPPSEYAGTAAPDELHLLTVQPATRLHGQLDNAAVSLASKIQGREPITLNPTDAATRGVEAGQVVRVFNTRGACLAGVVLSDAVMPGIAVMATGAWLDPLEPGVPGSLCVHGNPNVLTHDTGTSSLGQGPSVNCLVRIASWIDPLPPIRVHTLPLMEA
jgi:biotin/methionine sulfoxide reductase